MDKYDYLIALATLDARDDDIQMFKELDDSDVVLSDRIQKKIEKLIRRESTHRASGFAQFKNILSKAAIIMLVVISVMFTAMISISAIRTAIWEIVTEWYEEYVAVGYEPEEGLEVVEPPTKIEEIRKPTLLPLGAEEEVVANGKRQFACDYYLGENWCLTFNQFLIQDEVGKFDGEHAEVREITIGEYKAYLLTYAQNEYTIHWNDGEYAYSIMSDVLSLDDLIAVAKNVK
jgi:hypothetical protein